MTEIETLEPTEAGARFSFNLWEKPWIGIVWPDGATGRLSIYEGLLKAHEIKALYDPSPLVVAGTHRLLAAILQDIYRPDGLTKIGNIWQAGLFDSEHLGKFAYRFAARFELFSETEPFMQAPDIPPIPPKKKRRSKKSTNDSEMDDADTGYVAKLYVEEPAGNNLVHFKHMYQEEQAFCPACAAGGLVTQPAFAKYDGRGYKASINGAPPPVYVFPAGSNLFQTLALSLVGPGFQPSIAVQGVEGYRDEYGPVWRKPYTFDNGEREVRQISYLESLTFPARKIRLYPEARIGKCTRCGQDSDVLITKMHLEMGKHFFNTRSGETPWDDPFVAYENEKKAKGKPPDPVCLGEGKALWREFWTLFLSQRKHDRDATKKAVWVPYVVSQLASLTDYGVKQNQFSFRCIGVRADQAKALEWVDETLDVPVGLLSTEATGQIVYECIKHAEDWEKSIKQHFDKFRKVAFPNTRGGSRSERSLLQTVKETMVANYWTRLSPSFRDFIHSARDQTKLEKAVEQWTDAVLNTGKEVLDEAMKGVGNRSTVLRSRVQILAQCEDEIATNKRRWLGGKTHGKRKS